MADMRDLGAPKQGAGFIGQAGLLFVAVAIFNIFSLLFQLFMVRNLTPLNFGVLNSLFSILAIVSIPSGTLQTVVAKLISICYASNHQEKIRSLLCSFVKKTSFFGFVALFILVVGSRNISSFIQVTSPVLIVILGVVTCFSILLPLANGGLQGLQKFGYLGLSMITNGGLKLLLGIIFVNIGLGVMGAMTALAISMFITLVLTFLALGSALPKTINPALDSQQLKSNNPGSEMGLGEISRYFSAVGAVLLCFAILTNLDVVLVKHFFDPKEAGYYSIAQMVGKIILFLPIALTLVMFPRACEHHARAKDTSHFLRTSLLCVGVLCGTATLICLLFPDLIIRLLSGRENPECIPLARIFSVAMFFFALVYVLLFYNLSVHRLGFIYLLVVFTIFQVLAIVFFHQSLMQILYIMCANASLLFMILVYPALTPKVLNAACDSDTNP